MVRRSWLCGGGLLGEAGGRRQGPDFVIDAAVNDVVDAAESWLGWDGRPVYLEGNAWTPHQAMRHVGDHLLDHRAEIECRLAVSEHKRRFSKGRTPWFALGR